MLLLEAIPLKQVTGLAAYRQSPTGAYVISSSFLVWCADPELYGMAVWGSPDEAEIRRLCELLDVEVREDAVPHASLVDLRYLRHVAPAAFAAFAEHLQTRAPRYRELVTRQARVRPTGLPGAIVAGFDKIVVPAHPVSVEERLEDALLRLGREEPDLVEELETLVTTATGELPTLARVRRMLVSPLDRVTLENVARALGLSPRTLQRRLQNEGTSFQAEHAAAQVRAAQRLLHDTDMTIAKIAIQVGCGSLASFSTMFRRQTGEMPSAWRKRARACSDAGTPED